MIKLSNSVWGRTVTWAALAWFLVLAFISVRVIVQPRTRSLYLTYATAGEYWLQGAELYRQRWLPPLYEYRYSPPASVLLVPLHFLPERLGNVLWRLLNAGVFLGAFGWWLRLAAPVTLTWPNYGLLYLLLVPLSLGSLNNGQVNPLLIGLLLGGMAAAASERWTLSAFCLALAAVFKIYPLAAGLLLAAVFPRRLGLRLAGALMLLALVPFLAQRSDYVANQYGHWWQGLGEDDRRFFSLDYAYRDLWLLFRASGIPLSPTAYLAIQLLTAAGCALICVEGRRRNWPRKQILLAVLMLGTCWMVLCGPASESCTLVLLAPAYAWAVLSAAREHWPLEKKVLIGGASLCFLFALLGGLTPYTNKFHALGPHPLGTLLLSLSYLVDFLRTGLSPGLDFSTAGEARK